MNYVLGSFSTSATFLLFVALFSHFSSALQNTTRVGTVYCIATRTRKPTHVSFGVELLVITSSSTYSSYLWYFDTIDGTVTHLDYLDSL